MFESEDEFVTDKKTSCSREEAIAKMLGWLQGTKRRPFTEITEFGISEDQLIHTHSFDELSVLDLLTDHVYSAQKEYFASIEAGDLVEVVQAKELKVKKSSERLEKAKQYFIDFDDEVADTDSSAIKLHQIDTEHYGVEHYTLKSVDHWTKKNYKISVIDQNKGTSIESNHDDDIDESDVEAGFSKTIANNLYITFALLIEDHVKGKGTAFKHSDGRINVSTLASYIKKMADACSPTDKLPGQSLKTIQIHINKAIAAKREALS